MEEVNQGYQSLSHSKWDCKYHVMFIPKKGAEAIIWTSPAPFRENIPCSGPAEPPANTTLQFLCSLPRIGSLAKGENYGYA